MYETYVGAKQFESDDPVFEEIRNVGEEYGATTGRPRQCNWMSWELLEKAININGVTDLIMNKVDVLEKVGKWQMLVDGGEIIFPTSNQMQDWIFNHGKLLPTINNVSFSGQKDRI